MTTGRIWGQRAVYRPVRDLVVADYRAAQARLRAARWHEWLNGPECTLQDRQNFESWRRHAINAAAYDALMQATAASPVAARSQ